MTPARRAAVLGTILALGAILRLEGLGRESFWHDESWSWALARGDAGRLLHHLRHHDAHPPLYYLLAAAAKPLGSSEAAIRLVSALAGIASIPLLFRLGSRLYGGAAGALAALLLALSPAHVAFSQEARCYSLLLLLTLGSLNLLFDLRDGPHRGKWAAFAALSAAIMLTHYLGSFFLLAEALGAIFLRRARPGFLKEFLLASAVAFVLFLPWLPTFWAHVRDIAGSFWIPPVSLERVWMAIFELVGHIHYTDNRTKALTSVPFFALALVPLLRAPRREDAALLAALFAPIAGEILVSLLGRPIFYTRTFLYVLPPLFALAAAGLFRLPPRAHAAGSAALAGLMLPCLLFARAVPEKEGWRDAVAILERGAGPDDRIVVAPGFAGVNVEYYASRGAAPWLDQMRLVDSGTLDRPGLPKERILREVLDSAAGVWLVLRYGQDEGWFAALEGAFERRSAWKSRGADMVYFRRR
jgi:4-amino-4-deoxy-L-arabinose transferase-like glycosyltransferase